MHAQKSLKAFAAATLLVAVSACVVAPIYNVTDAPVTTAAGKSLSATQVRQAIVTSGAALGWKIVESLHLEGVRPEDIEPDAPLFRDGLGLDSLDMLELSMAIEQKHAVKLRSDDPDNEKIFASLRSLAAHIRQKRTR